jgi:C-terminal processing protease CtpA/Prc
MHRNFRTATRLLLFALATASAATGAPLPAAPARIDRLVHLAKLWGTVRYFHPYLAYRDVDWDAAAVAAIPQVRAARTEGDYRQAVAGMLAVLGDPATRVEPAAVSAGVPGVPPPASPHSAIARWAEDGLLVLDFRPYSGYAIYTELPSALAQVMAEIPKARAVVFDLRGHPAEGEAGVDYSTALDGVAGDLVDRPLRAPSRRYLVHSGFRSQDVSYGTYYSAFTTPFATAYSPTSPEAAATPPSSPKPPKRVVFLVTSRTVLPEIAVALQAGGEGRIVSEGRFSPDAFVATTPVDLGEGLTARVRTSETLPLPGWPGVHADAEVPPGGPGGPDAALDAALQMARTPGVVPAPAAAVPLPEAVFHPDRTYAEMRAPELPYRLLAVFRYWNVIHYFYPYKALIGDWDGVLPQLLARMEEAEGARGYAEAVLAMSTRVPDGHTNAYGHPEIPKILGESRLPLQVRWIEGAYVVTAEDDDMRKAGIEVGDVLLAVDGEPVAARAARLRRFVTAATEAALRNRIGGLLANGAARSTAVLTLSGQDGAPREIRVERVPRAHSFRPQRPGPVVQVLPGNIGYADLTRLETAQVDGMFEQLAKTRAIVFDMRGYPHGTAWGIASRLGQGGAKVAARFRRAEVSALVDGDMDETSFAFAQTLPVPAKLKYTGRTVMLIDDRAISQSEHSGLFYEAANGTRFVGSPSAGANGDVTVFTLPGGITITFSGHDVRHADGRQLQRVGLQPDIPVEPTIAGIRQGKDEVLERAVQYLADNPL